jgi:CTP:molybdopterin cytidylyltransferase MocA
MSRVGCAILAAGASRRLGRPKQLVLWRGHELVRHLALQALSSRASEVAVIVGAHSERIVPAVSDLPVSCVVNLGWREGVASSIRCATHWAAKKNFEALIVMASDQPHLDMYHLDRLISEHEQGAVQVASRYGGIVGIPALFGEIAFRRLFTLSGDVGASSILRDEPDTRSIEWPAGEIDIDTTRDLSRLFDELGEPRPPVDYLCSFDSLATQDGPRTTENSP